ncbi:MAG: serine/threonine protein kinase [Polyangiaceae bacterium]|nr:serine/threonine protein kinase [Polyangiaceae bacterium]
MSQRFLRCPHCGLPHAEAALACPTSGRPIERPKPTTAPPPARESARPPAPTPGPAARAGSTPAPSEPPPDARRLIGTVVDGVYSIGALIGRGGMATIYEAEQLVLGRKVALKVLPVERSDAPEAQRRFLREARAASVLNHPNICQVFDFGALPDGRPYFTMERLYGETLGERIEREGALPFFEVIDIVIQALAGLGAAHKKGIIHRDVKPENVFLVAREGKPAFVKLLDFGVAKAQPADDAPPSDDTTQITRTGVVMGTPYYMAPEQALGDRHFDPRVDLWSCGVLLYEAVTGKRPFGATTHHALLQAIISDRPHRVTELRPGAPGELELVIDKALEKDRERRYQTAVEFIGDLQRVRERLVRRAQPV